VQLVDPKATKPVAKQVTVLPAHLEGWVTAIAGSTLTVTDDSGFTRKVSTTATTTYTKDGKAATAAAVTVGSFLGAGGAVDADGTTLDATMITLGRPAFAPGPGGPGKGGGFRGFGGFGGFGGGPGGGPGHRFGGPLGPHPSAPPTAQPG
jgi:hypothetical protein